MKIILSEILRFHIIFIHHKKLLKLYSFKMEFHIKIYSRSFQESFHFILVLVLYFHIL